MITIPRLMMVIKWTDEKRGINNTEIGGNLGKILS